MKTSLKITRVKFQFSILILVTLISKTTLTFLLCYFKLKIQCKLDIKLNSAYEVMWQHTGGGWSKMKKILIVK